MTIRKILTPLTGSGRDAASLAAAIAAARACGAKVQALFVRPDPSEALPYMGEGVSGAVIQDIIRVAKDAADRALADAKTALQAAAAAANVPVVGKLAPGPDLAVALMEAQGPFEDIVAEEARLSDLVVFGPVADEAGVALRGALESALMAAGRPILLAPRGKVTALGASVAVGWDGSATAAHAVSAALPFLTRAGKVTVLTVGHAGAQAQRHLEDLKAYLALHGVSATSQLADPAGKPVAEALPAAAAAAGADLLVMGGYGHSRLREFVLGGVTRHVIAAAPLPVLMAH